MTNGKNESKCTTKKPSFGKKRIKKDTTETEDNKLLYEQQEIAIDGRNI